jgi:hypothetical protein
MTVTSATPVKVMAQVRELTDNMTNEQFSVPPGEEVQILLGQTRAADTTVTQPPGTQPNVEYYRSSGTPWGQGSPLLGGLAITGYIGPLYVRCDPAATADADVRVMQTIAVARQERF